MTTAVVSWSNPMMCDVEVASTKICFDNRKWLSKRVTARGCRNVSRCRSEELGLCSKGMDAEICSAISDKGMNGMKDDCSTSTDQKSKATKKKKGHCTQCPHLRAEHSKGRYVYRKNVCSRQPTMGPTRRGFRIRGVGVKENYTRGLIGRVESAAQIGQLDCGGRSYWRDPLPASGLGIEVCEPHRQLQLLMRCACA